MSHPILLHVGLPKTGTTSLQGNLFARHPELSYCGKPLLHHDPEMRAIVRPIVEEPPASFDPERHRRERIDPFVARARGPVLISEEEFSTGTVLERVSRVTIADRLAILFPEATVVMAIREQTAVLQSLYAHLVQMGFMDRLSFPEWIALELESPFESSRLRLFDYADVHARFAERFGSERVKVCLFERLRDDPDGFVGEICRLAGVTESTGIRLFRSAAARNTRVSLWQVHWRRWRAAHPRHPFPRILRRIGAESFLERCLARGPRIDTTYAPGQSGRLREVYRASNWRLVERTGLDLARHGYSV